MRTQQSRVLVYLLLCAPLALYAACIIRSLAHSDSFAFRRLDLWLLVAATLYAAVIFIVLLWLPRYVGRVLAMLYSALLAIGVAEAILYIQEAPLSGLPLQPGRVHSQAADTMPGISGTRTFSVNAYGVRAPEITFESADLRILCVGGSSVESVQVTDEESWPWLMGQILSKELGKPVLCANAGRSGHLALNHAYLLKHYKHAQRFDCVVVMCGINDLGSFLRKDYAVRAAEVGESTLLGRPLELEGPYYRALSCVRLTRQFRRGVARTEASGNWYANQRVTRTQRLRFRAFNEPPPDLGRALARYRSDLETIVQICRSRNQRLLFLTQPTLYRADLPDDLASLLWEYCDEGAYTPAALEKAMAAYNGTLLDMCRDKGIPCLDLAARVPRDMTVFYDDCHFNTPGSQKVAELVSEWITALLKHPIN